MLSERRFSPLYIILCIIAVGISAFFSMDGLRDTFIPGSSLSYLKEIFTLSGFVIFVLTMYWWRSGYLFYLIFLLFLFLLFEPTVSSFMVDQVSSGRTEGLSFGSWSVVIKIYACFFAFCFFSACYRFSPGVIDIFRNSVVVFAVIYSIITIFFIASGLQSTLPPRNWVGRLSVGYPTMDSFVLSCALCFIYQRARFRVQEITAFGMIFLTLVFQNTVVGYLCILILGVLFLSGMKLGMKVLTIFLIAVSIPLFLTYYSEILLPLGRFGTLLIDKINGFIFGHETSSISIRKLQMQAVTGMLSEPGKFCYGVGGAAAYMVEIGYVSILGMFGLIGSCIYFFLSVIVVAVLIYRKDLPSLAIMGILLVANSALVGVYLFPMFIAFAYLLATVSSPVKSPTRIL